MKVLLINKFLYPRGGDAVSALETASLLSSRGDDVYLWGMAHPDNGALPFRDYFVSYVDFNSRMTPGEKVSSLLRIFYSREARRKITKFLDKTGDPDIVHLNNFAHHISPSILGVFRKRGIPMVMTFRDYKIICPAYSLLRDGKICEMCRGGKYFHCLLKKCVKGSAAKSLVSCLEMYWHHSCVRAYAPIYSYISPSLFLREKTREWGFRGKIDYLPNFVKTADHEDNPDDSFSLVFVGRLSREKGLHTLLKAAGGSGVKVAIIGDGPLRSHLREEIKNSGLDNVTLLGYQNSREIRRQIRKSWGVVLPSICYENNPRVVLEAFAEKRAVIASNLGGIPELVKDGETGCLFRAGDHEDLRKKIRYFKNNRDKVLAMGRQAGRDAAERFSPEGHYQRLREIYLEAISKGKRWKGV